MKLSKKVIALLLVLSIALSVIVPISLTSGAATTQVSGHMNATVHRPVLAKVNYEDILDRDFYGGQDKWSGTFIEETDAKKSHTVDGSGLKKFDASIKELLDNSFLKESVSATKIEVGSSDNYIMKWQGTMKAKESGIYTLVGDDIDNGFVMKVNDKTVYEYWGGTHWVYDGNLVSNSGSFEVVKDESYDVEVYFLEIGGGDALKILATTSPEDLNDETKNEDAKNTYDINNVFEWNLTRETYCLANVDNWNSYTNDTLVGHSTGDGNGGQCESGKTDLYDESIGNLLNAFTIEEEKVVSDFSEPIVEYDSNAPYVITYKGVLVPNKTGKYTFGAKKIDNGFYLNIDDTVAYEFWRGKSWNDIGDGNNYYDTVTLETGKEYPFTAAFLETDGNQGLELVASVDGGDRVNVNDWFTYYPYNGVTLDFNLQAVNLLSGAPTVNSNSELTVQYTDATLGDSVEMYAQITKTDGTVLVDKQQVGSGFLRVENRDVYEDTNTVNRNIYSNMAGSVTFKPALSETYNVSELKVTVWTESDEGRSNEATTTINNGFTNGTPTGLNPNNWMSYIDGATLLTQINLPGTHDSGAVYTNSDNISKCQNVFIASQLSYGVRYLDMRFDGEASSITVNGMEGVRNINICHGDADCYIDSSHSARYTFNSVYADCKAFLEANPSETIIMTLQADGGFARGTLMDCIATFVKADPSLFYTKTNEIPTLDDVRGKIVVLRKFPDAYYGGDYAGMDFFWQDKPNGTEHAVIPVSGGNAVTTYFVQDDYGKSARDGWGYTWYPYSYPKWEMAQAFFETAAANKKANQFYLNFLSTAPTGSNPITNASYTNAQFTSYAAASNLVKGEQYGYILFDAVTTELCKYIYQTNIFTTTAQASSTDNEKAHEIVVNYDFATVKNGKLDDTADNGFDGTLVNTSLLEANSIYDTITFNNANARGDSAGYIDIPQSVFRGTGDTATIQVWIKDAGNNGNDTWLSIGNKGGGIDENWFIANTNWNGGAARYSIKTTKVQGGGEEIQQWDTKNSGNADDNKWQLLTYVLNGDNMKIYVNGNPTPVVDGKMNANFSDVYGTMINSPVRLGAASYHLNDASFIGSMGDFTIYNYALSADEIAADYKDLAEEYTYILKATLGGNIVAVASEEAADTYIDEQHTDAGNAIWFTVPSDYDITNAKLALEIDGSKVEISTDGGTYTAFNADATYDLSKDVVLKVTSLNSTRTKEYDVKVNGIVVKDYATDVLVGIYDALPTLEEKEGYLAIGYYDSAMAEIVTTPEAGDTVYQRYIKIEKPSFNQTNGYRSIRITEPYGLRFKAEINRESEFYQFFNNGNNNYVYSEDADFTFGMLIIPADILKNADLNKETDSVLNIVGVNVRAQDENVLQYTGVLCGIRETQWNRQMVARAYITYKYNGKTETVYSDTVQGSYLEVGQLSYEVVKDKTDAQSLAAKEQLEKIFGDQLTATE